jgi:single-stranded-DNA-specific exonuclease
MPSGKSKKILGQTSRFQWRAREDFFSGLGDFLSVAKTKVAERTLADLPPPNLMKDLEKATVRICKAAEAHDPIFVFGDYDVDGTTSAAMLRVFFDELGIETQVYIPERLVEGYGLNPIGVQNIFEKCGGKNSAKTILIVTVDNGIAAVAGCAKAKELGIEVIITDHHDLPPVLPDAFAIVNPKQTDCSFTYPMLAGVGVAFYLMISVRAHLRKEGLKSAENLNLRSYLDFVALGTIADLAPLDGVNHCLCKIGLQVMSENISAGKRPGIAALLKLAGWKSEDGAVNATDVGFKIGPRLNAAGRLGTALSTIDLLTQTNVSAATKAAEVLHAENTERQTIEKQITAEALAQADKIASQFNALVLYDPSWHTGVVGIVASRVLEKHYKPTLVFGELDGMAKGSGRSTHAFNLFEAMNSTRSSFKSFGGHFHAVGASLDPEKLADLQQHLHKVASEKIALEDRLSPLNIDGATQLKEFTLDLLEELSQNEPFGVANPRPKWLVRQAQLQSWERMGKSPQSTHARIYLKDTSVKFATAVVAFGFAEPIETLVAEQQHDTTLDVVIEARTQIFRGKKQIELRLVDFRLFVPEN